MRKFVYGMLLTLVYMGSNFSYAYSTSTYLKIDSTKKDTTKGLKASPTDTLKTKRPKSE